tara:strand:- start:336 stop:1637 length:1302 start_codon:yes stop_codon:yes gene_type:complete
MEEWVQEPPIIIEHGDGRYLVDIEGNRYYDGVSSIWVNIHGHRTRALDQAIRTQLEKIAHSTLLGLSNVPSIELAKQLTKIAPLGLQKVFYSDNGSTAMEIAMKLAFQYWQQQGRQFRRKKKFLAFDMAYHGDSLGTVSLSGISLFHKTYKPLLFKTFRADPPYCYRCPMQFRYPSCRLACLHPIEATLRDNHQDIAALVIEPMIQSVGGMITSPPGYLKAIRELCTRYDVLLIADEVASGFGRTGKMFACDHEDVTPDLMAISKGLTGGYMPLAATLTTQRIYDGFLGSYDDFKTFFHGHSYTGNPLGCAVALANLKLFRRTKLLKILPKKVCTFELALRTLKSLAHVGQVRQIGLMAGIELIQNKQTKQPYRLEDRIGHRIAMETREHGLIIRPNGNILILMPPLTATHNELKVMVDIVKTAIQSITRFRR